MIYIIDKLVYTIKLLHPIIKKNDNVYIYGILKYFSVIYIKKIFYFKNFQCGDMVRYNIRQLSKHNREQLGRNIDISVFRMVRFMDLEKYLGKGAHGVIYDAGKKLGHELNPKSIEEITEFCKGYKIGIIEIVEKNPLCIRVNECISCNGLSNCGEPLCWFEGGFIAGCLEKVFNKKVRAKETHCAGLGDKFCQFEIKFIK